MLFQSTPPRRWWHSMPDKPFKTYDISIHTTTQVVTPSRQRLKPCLTDFNPHHHAGGDFYSESHWNYIIYFNPHHHAGGDVAIMSCWSIRFYFNPHHHAGGDQPYGVHIWKYVKFQSTPPRRWWPYSMMGKGWLLSFQSTPPRRWWLIFMRRWLNNILFQSTPPRRWWHQYQQIMEILYPISIHTTTQVVTQSPL